MLQGMRGRLLPEAVSVHDADTVQHAAVAPRVHLLWTLILLVACGSPPVHSSVAGNKGTPPPDDWVACKADADCEPIEMGCCDHCNGGWVLAVERGHAQTARTQVHEKCEAQVSCTELACGKVGARCDGGRCTWTWDAHMDGSFADQPNRVLTGR